MPDTDKAERGYLRYWPLLVYGIIAPLNTDAIIPLGLLFKVPRETLLLTVPLLASLELCYGFWFWGWWIIPQVPRLEKVREARRELQQEGLLDWWVIDRVLRVYHRVIDPHNGTRRRIKRWGIVAVWVAGINPISLIPTRSPCGAVLGTLRLKNGLYHLLAANAIHAVGMIYGWNWLLGR